jgi:hypothetical protein
MEGKYLFIHSPSGILQRVDNAIFDMARVIAGVISDANVVSVSSGVSE